MVIRITPAGKMPAVRECLLCHARWQAFRTQGPEIRPARPYPQIGGNRPPQTLLGGGNYPVGMGYVPIQSWQQPYALETAFRRGTIFPDLDLPFMMGGAC